MKSKAEFDIFYDLELKKPLEQLEARRLVLADKHSFKRYKRNLKWMAMACVVLVIASASAPTVIPMYVAFCIPATALYAIVAAIVIAVRRSSAFKPIEQEYKQTIIPKILAFIQPGLQYKSTEGILNEEFNSSELYDQPSTYHSEDLVVGNVDGMDVRLSDIKCSVASRSTGTKSSTRHTVFQGLYVIVKGQQKFGARLRIKRENFVTDALGKFARSLLGNELIDKLNEKLDLKDLELGNAEFDKAYSVHCSDEAVARQILTPALVQLLLAFSKELNAPVNFAFFDNQMHVAIDGIDLFETDPYTSIVEADVSRIYFNSINLTLGVAQAVQGRG